MVKVLFQMLTMISLLTMLKLLRFLHAPDLPQFRPTLLLQQKQQLAGLKTVQPPCGISFMEKPDLILSLKALLKWLMLFLIHLQALLQVLFMTYTYKQIAEAVSSATLKVLLPSLLNSALLQTSVTLVSTCLTVTATAG